MGDTFEAPKVCDGVIWRVLEGLRVLDGERLSYRTLDVEQIGSVYESMMGFELGRMEGRSLAVKPKHIVFDVDVVLGLAAGKRGAWLKEQTECDLTGAALTGLKDAKSAEDVVAAVGRKLSGTTPEQISELKVCDPAMGSGAFLVEACRQMAEALVTAWTDHGSMPTLPADEDPLLYARRLVAQRCLYGVDKNPYAVNLAKLSLWLVTLARAHPFTFLDHALKHGDVLGMGFTFDDTNPEATPSPRCIGSSPRTPATPSGSSRTLAARKSTRAPPTPTTATS